MPIKRELLGGGESEKINFPKALILKVPNLSHVKYIALYIICIVQYKHYNKLNIIRINLVIRIIGIADVIGLTNYRI